VSILVSFTVGLAFWHYTVFIPDRFWGGIVGALLGATTGAMFSGLIGQLATGRGVGDADYASIAFAVPGTFLGLAAIWALGVRRENQAAD